MCLPNRLAKCGHSNINNKHLKYEKAKNDIPVNDAAVNNNGTSRLFRSSSE